MFEAKTYPALLSTALSAAPDGIDTRQGAIFYDAVAAVCQIVAGFYVDLEHVNELISIDSAVDAYLDDRAAERGLYRQTANFAQYAVAFTGAAPAVGARFFYDGLYFVYVRTIDGTDLLECETAGTAGNVVPSGAHAVPVDSAPGLTATAFGALSVSGADSEADDSLRRRLKEVVATPPVNGNRQHYKTWCESIDGVGRARIVPLSDGPNTVKAYIIGDDGTPAAQTVVDAVQAFIDPDANGNGAGVANLGAIFAAATPDTLAINVACAVTLATGGTTSGAASGIESAVTAYLKALALDTPDGEYPVVRISAIGALIGGVTDVLDYSGLTLNGASSNIQTAVGTLAVLGTVTVT